MSAESSGAMATGENGGCHEGNGDRNEKRDELLTNCGKVGVENGCQSTEINKQCENRPDEAQVVEYLVKTASKQLEELGVLRLLVCNTCHLAGGIKLTIAEGNDGDKQFCCGFEECGKVIDQGVAKRNLYEALRSLNPSTHKREAKGKQGRNTDNDDNDRIEQNYSVLPQKKRRPRAEESSGNMDTQMLAWENLNGHDKKFKAVLLTIMRKQAAAEVELNKLKSENRNLREEVSRWRDNAARYI